MQKNILVIVLACVFSTPSFASVVIDSGCSNCTCVCDDDCDNCACYGDCTCIVDFSGPLPVANCSCGGQINSGEQSSELIFDSITTNLEDVAATGMFGPPEGTFPDYEEIYVIDGESALTNEIDVLPSWCE